MSKKNVEEMNDQELIAYAIELYDQVVPVADIMAETGITRTRLYNNLRKRGETPNRQVSTVKAEADRQTAFYKEEADRAREEVGEFKYKVTLLEAEIEKLKEANKKLKEQATIAKVQKMPASTSVITTTGKKKASKK